MKVSGNTYIISRVYLVIVYLLDRLSDEAFIGEQGGYSRQAGRQMGTKKIHNRKIFLFFFPTRKSQSVLLFLIYLRIWDSWISCLYLSDFLSWDTVVYVTGFYLSFL